MLVTLIDRPDPDVARIAAMQALGRLMPGFRQTSSMVKFPPNVFFEMIGESLWEPVYFTNGRATGIARRSNSGKQIVILVESQSVQLLDTDASFWA